MHSGNGPGPAARMAGVMFALCGGRMDVHFSPRNEIDGISVGEASFATGGGDMWSAEFAAKGDLSDRAVARPSAARAATREDGPESVVLRWTGIPLGGADDALDAKVEIARHPDGSQSWRLEFENRSPDRLLFATEFPRLSRAILPGRGDAMLPAKDHGARLFRGWTPGAEPFAADYLGYAPMVAAFFEGADGLYFAAEDPEARIKSFVAHPDGTVAFATPCELGAKGPLHAVTLAPLRGDWWDAARRYRNFALKQKWASKGPAGNRTGRTRRACEIPLWINLHGSPADAQRVLERAGTLFPEFPTGLHWHLWQHSPHDVDYPEYFPAQPGAREAVRAAAAAGQEPMPYVNGRLWSADTAGYVMAEPFAVMKPDGTRLVETYARSTPPLAVMCPAAEPWRRTVAKFTGRVLSELGPGSVFIDQVGAAPGCPCYDPSHGHPAGGGAWWRDGYAAMLEPVRRKWNAAGAFVVTEGGGEAYIDLVDGFLQVVERTPEDVPFLNAVYSGMTAYIGSPENVDDPDASFLALQTRELLWGNSLGWFLPDVLDMPGKCEILRRLCVFRQRNLDALAYGSLVDELRFAEDPGSLRCEWKGRRPHYALFDKTWKCPPGRSCEMPAVVGAWWRTAGGETVLLVANISPGAKSVRAFLPDGAGTASLALAPHELRRVPLDGLSGRGAK